MAKAKTAPVAAKVAPKAKSGKTSRAASAKTKADAKTNSAEAKKAESKKAETKKAKAEKSEAEELSVKKLLAPFRVTDGKEFRLEDHPTEDDREDFDFDKAISKALLADGIGDLQKLQELLYADNRWSLLVIFQAMDAAGKDSTIEAVMSGVNPQGARSTPSSVPPTRSSTTISCGGPPRRCPNADGSGSSTGPTTRRSGRPRPSADLAEAANPGRPDR